MKLTRWDTKEVIFELECSSWEQLLKGALKAKISFYRADFSNSDFSGSNFSDSNFSNSNFSNSNFRCSDFSGSDFSGSNFSDSNFSNSNFSNSNFSNSNFRNSDFSNSNLRYSDFSGSNFRYSNFSGSKFIGSCHQYKIGNMREWKSMQIDKYMIVFNRHILAIGCQQHKISEWKNFTDKKISSMDTGALEWWTKWKEFIFTAIELSYGDVK